MAVKLFFSPTEYMQRINALKADAAARGVDAVLVTGPENITYLTGYQTPGYHIFQCLIVPVAGEVSFVVRNNETTNIPSIDGIGRAFPIGVANLSDPAPVLVEAIRTLGLAGAALGYDGRSLFFPPAVYTTVRVDLPGVRFSDVAGIVEARRMRKSHAEIELIRQGVAMAEDALRAGVAALAGAATDSDVAAAVLASLSEAGSEYTGSPAYIVPGVHALQTHTTHARRPIVDGEPLRMEICASVGRYHGAVTRTAVRGPVSGAVADAMAVAAAACDAMIDAAVPGTPLGEVDRAGRSIVEDAYDAEYWPNRGAYSMGISYPPGLGEGDVLDIRPGDTRVTEEGMVFHLLPNLRVPGVGSIGCTETFAVTAAGGVTMSTLPRVVLQP
ncbi:M24 family metallopeptidase [Actinomadura macra]|uniref:M24 family metallopeptidase n=1 Tax=Actinomadura macra TaxID=46164 RepID=UPI00082BA863|nr:Xaa-Pro peptidase family protein [Actinomadura macra]